MRRLFKLVLQILANAVSIFAAAYFLPKLITFKGNWTDYLIVGVILTIANLIIRPVLKIITAPLIFITLGLFLIVINAAILFGVDWFVEELTIASIWGYIWVSLIVSIVNTIIVGAIKKKPKI